MCSVDVERVNMRQLNFFVSGPQFTKSFLLNVGGTVLDITVSRLSISRSVPEIFLIRYVKMVVYQNRLIFMCVEMRQLNFVVSGPNFAESFSSLSRL